MYSWNECRGDLELDIWCGCLAIVQDLMLTPRCRFWIGRVAVSLMFTRYLLLFILMLYISKQELQTFNRIHFNKIHILIPIPIGHWRPRVHCLIHQIHKSPWSSTSDTLIRMFHFCLSLNFNRIWGFHFFSITRVNPET